VPGRITVGRIRGNVMTNLAFCCNEIPCEQDVVLGRKTVGLIRGDILTNGYPKQQAVWARMCGYVEQQVRGAPARVWLSHKPEAALAASCCATHTLGRGTGFTGALWPL